MNKLRSKPPKNLLYRVALENLGNFKGDADVAEDLGISTTAESLEMRLASAEQARHILRYGENNLNSSDSPSARELARAKDHEDYNHLYNLTGPRTEQEAEAASAAAQLGRPAVEEAIRVAREGNSNREQ